MKISFNGAKQCPKYRVCSEGDPLCGLPIVHQFSQKELHLLLELKDVNGLTGLEKKCELELEMEPHSV